MITISSRNNRLIVDSAKLHDKKYRDQSSLFFFEGRKLLSEAIASSVDIVRVFLTEKNADMADLLPDSTEKYIVTNEVYAKLTEEKSPEGVFSVAKHLDSLHIFATIYKGANSDRCLAAVSLRDPGNLGTLMRTSAALGLDCLIISSDCADIYSPKTVRASMGAVFRLRTLRTDSVCETLASLPACGITPMAACLSSRAATLGISALPNNVCFVVGNEGHGLDTEVISSCAGGEIIIPMAEGAESLNVSVAASILLWEDRRRRL
ncbi:MAG: RNA methyltransferase [Clostridia bacterium]|nr:RNA methyltransferase [Clostridia bacterium]